MDIVKPLSTMWMWNTFSSLVDVKVLVLALRLKVKIKMQPICAYYDEVKGEFAEIDKEDVIVKSKSLEQFPEGSYMKVHNKSIWHSNILEEINMLLYYFLHQKKWAFLI